MGRNCSLCAHQLQVCILRSMLDLLFFYSFSSVQHLCHIHPLFKRAHPRTHTLTTHSHTHTYISYLFCIHINTYVPAQAHFNTCIHTCTQRKLVSQHTHMYAHHLNKIMQEGLPLKTTCLAPESRSGAMCLPSGSLDCATTSPTW